MEGLILFLVLLIILVVIGSIAGLIAAARSARLDREVRALRNSLKSIRSTLARLDEELKHLASRRPPAPAPAAPPEPTPEEKAEATGALVEIAEDAKPLPPKELAPAALEKKPEEKPVEEEAEKPPVTASPLPKRGESIAEAAKRLAESRREAARARLVPGIPSILRKPEEPVAAHEVRAKPKTVRDQEWWKKLEETAGKYWITWVGAIVLFLSLGLFVKYAFDNKWLGPTGRVILGVVAGIIVTAAGERFVRRKMRPLGQGLIGAGLGILYVSLYASYGIYELLPQPVAFGFMVLVTAGGMVLAVVHDAIAISVLAIIGGFLTPVMLRTGRDPRDALFSYLLLLDLGVLGVAFFKRWKFLDILAFAGTWVFFTFWYFKFYSAGAAAPATLWLCAFYLVFLVSPYVYHLRKCTPITGERFFMAVTNAVVAFAFAFTILHDAHKHALGIVTLGMSACYLVLGSLTRRRIPEDVKAVFAFIAMSVTFLTIAVPILLDFNGVTVVWAAEAVLLLYLGYKYDYFLVRAGSLVSLLLAAGRIFTTHWPLHDEAFTPVFNSNFGTAIFVALAGGAFAIVYHLHRENASRHDRLVKIAVGIASGFLALTVIHTEVWQYFDLSGREHFTRWACALVWSAGAAGFLVAGMKLRSIHARFSGLLALVVVLVLAIWDYSLGIEPGYLMFFNGRFLGALAGILVVAAYGMVYRRWQEICSEDEKVLPMPFYGLSILLTIILVSFETWQWLEFRHHDYTGRWLLPLIWVAGTAGYMCAGFRLRCAGLRLMGLVTLSVAGILAGRGYAFGMGGPWMLCLNGRFLGALAVVLVVFAYALVYRRSRELCSEDEKSLSTPLYGIGIFLAIILATVETWLWLDARGHHYLARCLLPLIWSAGAGGYLGAGIRLRSVVLRRLGLAVLSVAAIFAAYGCARSIDGDYTIYLNGRFFAALTVILTGYVYARTLRYFGEITGHEGEATGIGVYGTAIMLLLVLVSFETWQWLDIHGHFYAARCILPVIWVAGAAGYLASGIRLRSPGMRFMCLSALFVAACFAVWGYAAGMAGNYILYLNGRFAAALAVVLMAFSYVHTIPRCGEISGRNETKAAWFLNVITIVALFILLSVETYLYCLDTVENPERARWVGQMSLSIVWGVYAGALLAVGFWRKVRTYRLCALGLFGLTALKLVIVDLAHIKEVYRIISFLVLGVLMIGVSYLYHRVEKWLEAAAAEKQPPEPAKDINEDLEEKS